MPRLQAPVSDGRPGTADMVFEYRFCGFTAGLPSFREESLKGCLNVTARPDPTCPVAKAIDHEKPGDSGYDRCDYLRNRIVLRPRQMVEMLPDYHPGSGSAECHEDRGGEARERECFDQPDGQHGASAHQEVPDQQQHQSDNGRCG